MRHNAPEYLAAETVSVVCTESRNISNTSMAIQTSLHCKALHTSATHDAIQTSLMHSHCSGKRSEEGSRTMKCELIIQQLSLFLHTLLGCCSAATFEYLAYLQLSFDDMVIKPRQ